MFEEKDHSLEEIGERLATGDGLKYHWDEVIKAYVCERCGTIKIFHISIIKHAMEHLKKGEEG